MRTPPAVKVCGLTRRSDAEAAAAAGAAYGGVILAQGRTRSVDAAVAAGIFSALPLRRVGVFVDAPREEILSAAGTAALDVVQLHGAEEPELAASLRAEGLTVWKALRPRSADELLAGISRFEGVVDGLLLDGWSPLGNGGTGTIFNWEEMAEHRDAIPGTTALIVAGGLTPDNVARAAEVLRPHVVDVSSGVESVAREKSHSLIRSFVAAATGTINEVDR